jgi:hypothetical protein
MVWRGADIGWRLTRTTTSSGVRRIRIVLVASLRIEIARRGGSRNPLASTPCHGAIRGRSGVWAVSVPPGRPLDMSVDSQFFEEGDEGVPRGRGDDSVIVCRDS